MEFKGKVTAVPAPERGVSQRGPWVRQTIVVEYESGQYPKSIALQNMKDAEKFGQIQIGQTGTFQVDFKTREYNGKFFTDINCWSWTLDQSASVPGDMPPF